MDVKRVTRPIRQSLIRFDSTCVSGRVVWSWGRSGWVDGWVVHVEDEPEREDRAEEVLHHAHTKEESDEGVNRVGPVLHGGARYG